HGFYTPLKVVHSLVSRMQFARIDASPILHMLGLTGNDRKNFVPVDWVSSVITHLSGQPQHRGRTYHLTPARPVTVETTSKAVEIALRESVEVGEGKKSEPPEWDELKQIVIGQMETYRSYWRDDPEFDRRNTSEAAPHLECPDVDLEMLLRMSRYALKSNFGWPRPQPLIPDFDALEHLRRVLPVSIHNGTDHSGTERDGLKRVGLQVNGPGGGQWTVTIEGGRPVSAECGMADGRHGLVYLNSYTFQRCVHGDLTVREAHRRGQLVMEGNPFSEAEMLGALEAIVAGNAVLQTAN